MTGADQVLVEQSQHSLMRRWIVALCVQDRPGRVEHGKIRACQRDPVEGDANQLLRRDQLLRCDAQLFRHDQFAALRGQKRSPCCSIWLIRGRH